MMKKFILIPVICVLALSASDLFAQAAKDVKTTAKKEIILPDMPKFDSVSGDPVLIRYKFVSGKKTGIDYYVDLDTEIAVDGRTMNVQLGMQIVGSYMISSVDENGDADAVLTMTRIKVESSTMPQLAFDSDQEQTGDDSSMAGLKAFCNAPMTVKVSSIGEIKNIDLNVIKEAMQKAGAAAQKMNIEKTADDMTKSSFVQLPKNKVKKGDVYEAGKIVQDMNGMAELSATVKYKVDSVSGDKKKVILRPSVIYKLEKKENSAYDITLNDGDLQGWMLFDLEKGNIERSSGITFIDMSISQGAQNMHMKMKAKVTFKTIEE
jgi:hypothetical protein